MKKNVLASSLIFAIATTSSLPVQASSIFIADTGTLTLTNDSDEFTYIQPTANSDCKTAILRDPSNAFPWGKDSEVKSASYSIYDEDWRGKTLALVNRIKTWRLMTLDKKLAKKGINKDDSKCITSSHNIMIDEISSHKNCEAQKKTYRLTAAGKLCLSDFEYGQLKIMQEQKQAEQSKQQEQQLFERQQQERAFEEQQRQQRQESINRQREAAMRMIMTPQQRTHCYGTAYNAAGMTTYNTSCY